jgi:Putative auto-transporter adhesin, head GIN domain
MKRVIFSAVFFAAMILTSALASGQSKETRNVRNFTKVSFGVSGDLFIKIGPEFHLTIEGDKRNLDEIETVVSGDRLTIKKENWRFSFRNDERVTINLTLPALEGLGVSGSGKAQIIDKVEADHLSLSVSGSGKLITAELNADDLNCGISGSGDILLESGGSVDNGHISISGSGGFSGEGVEIDHLVVSISGSGNCRCKAGDSLDAHISGSGNVTYNGNPKVNARVSGSGHVRSR